MDAGFMQGLSEIGVAGLMFLAYYILHQSSFSVIKSMIEHSTEAFSQAINEQREANRASLASITNTFDRIIANQHEADEKNYEILKDTTEAVQALAASIGRLEMKLDNLQNRGGGR